nr:hypothetical protein [Sedimentimonas flavescens]
MPISSQRKPFWPSAREFERSVEVKVEAAQASLGWPCAILAPPFGFEMPDPERLKPCLEAALSRFVFGGHAWLAAGVQGRQDRRGGRPVAAQKLVDPIIA